MHKVQLAYNEKGQVLLEVLVAIVILAAVMGSTLITASPSYEFTQKGRQRLHAEELLNQELETARAVRSQSWNLMIPNTTTTPYYCPVYNPTGNPPSSYQGWNLQNGKCTTSSDGYTAWIVVNSMYRQDTNTLSNSSTYPVDSNMIAVTATITWSSFGTSYNVSQTIYLSNWRPF